MIDHGRAGSARTLPASGLLLLAALSTFPVFADASAPIQTLPVEAIRAGMEGTARTVFQGDRLEDFRVEILGVIENSIGPGQDLILARLHGEKVEYTGVVAGMSGSPVYIDGKLIGALSYRIGNFAKEPIAGITPIADMLRLGASIGSRPDAGTAATGERESAAAYAPGPDLLARFLAADGGRGSVPHGSLSPVHGSDAAAAGEGTPAGAFPSFQPIGVPLVCSGCDTAVLGYYAPIFRAHGLEPGPGGGIDENAVPGALVPGSAIGGALVTGSLSLIGVGTLTHVDGNRVYAFGHPMLGVGTLDMPMIQAHILHTFASDAGSFKIANATRPVGRIVQDGLTAIVGEIGPTPPALPLRVGVTARGGRREFNYDILRHRTWSPVLAALSVANSLTRTTEFDTGATLALRARIDIEGHPPIEYNDLYAGTNPGQAVHLGLANEVGGLFGLISNNRFEDPRVRSATIEVEALPEGRVATLTALYASRPEVRPGETLKIRATLRLFRGEERVVVFEVVVPEDLPAGDVEILVGGGTAMDSVDRRMQERMLAQASGLGDILSLIDRRRRNDALYLRIARRSPAAIVRSELLPDLPLSIFSVYNSPRISSDTTLLNESPILEMDRLLDVVVPGGRRITVRVR